jgi:hypothetical protein
MISMKTGKFEREDYQELMGKITYGGILSAPKTELEQYLVMLSHQNAPANFAEGQHEQICETVRLLMMARISEESNREAKRISLIALWISVFALIAGLVQAVTSLTSCCPFHRPLCCRVKRHRNRKYQQQHRQHRKNDSLFRVFPSRPGVIHG